MLDKSGVLLELASLRQSQALIRFCLRSSAHTEGWGDTMRGQNPESLKRAALQGRESQQTVMCARGRSARGQMRSPSIAQRGEGGARGGSGESSPAEAGEPQAQGWLNAIKLIAAYACQTGSGARFDAESARCRPNRRFRAEGFTDRVLSLKIRPTDQVDAVGHGRKNTGDGL